MDFLHSKKIGVSLWVLAIFVMAFQTVQADSSYTETWTSSSYRHVRAIHRDHVDDGRWATPWVCIGPSIWDVRLYQDGTLRASETWAAILWKDSSNRSSSSPAQDLQFEYYNENLCYNADGGSNTDQLQWTLFPTGEYGVFAQYNLKSNDYHKNQINAAKSWPYAWSVSGTLYD